MTGNLPGEVFVAVRIENKIISEKIRIEEPTSLKLRRVEVRKRMKREVVNMVWNILSDNI